MFQTDMNRRGKAGMEVGRETSKDELSMGYIVRRRNCLVMLCAPDAHCPRAVCYGSVYVATRLEEANKAYGTKASSEKSKVLVNSLNQNIPKNIILNGQNVEEVDSFKYHGSSVQKYGTSRIQFIHLCRC